MDLVIAEVPVVVQQMCDGWKVGIVRLSLVKPQTLRHDVVANAPDVTEIGIEYL